MPLLAGYLTGVSRGSQRICSRLGIFTPPTFPILGSGLQPRSTTQDAWIWTTSAALAEGWDGSNAVSRVLASRG